MFKIGDIVRPKKYLKGHNYCFKIIEIQKEPFTKYLYRIQRIEQQLDGNYSPTLQLNTIRTVEQCLWEENELELAGPTPAYPQEIIHKGINSPTEQELNFFRTIVKGENKMQILEIYKERKRKVLDRELLEAKEKVKGEDEIQSIILEMTNQVNTILENQGKKVKYEFEPNLITTETEVKLDELNDNYYKEVESLHSTVEEIKAMFELTDDYNERMKILKRYGIINKEGKLSV